MRFQAFYPYPLVCATEREPVFPYMHTILRPWGGGFRDVSGKKCYRKGNFGEFFLVVDPVGLDPMTVPSKVASLLLKMLSSRYCRDIRHPRIVFLGYPIDCIDVAEAIREAVEELWWKPVEIFFYFPDMGARGFVEIFGHLPNLTEEEAVAQARSVTEEMRLQVAEKNWKGAAESAQLLEKLFRLRLLNK